MSEEYCKLVSTRGIAKSCDIFPIWKTNQNFTYDNLSIDMKTGTIVYLHFDMLEYFINNILDKLKNSCIIVSGNSDHYIPIDIPNHSKLLESSKLIAWFSQNIIEYHPKLFPIPIGLDYHTLSFPTGIHEWSKQITPISPVEQEKLLMQVKETLIPLNKLLPKVCANFQHSINGPYRRQIYRQKIYNVLRNKNIIWLPKQTQEEFWTSLKDIPYVICPFGNGPDTHRTWEVLALGRIPIIEKSPLNKIFEGLPILEIEDWNYISDDWLLQNFKNINMKEYNFEKLFLQYWINFIKSKVQDHL